MPGPLFHKKLLLERYPGKGGWTYARVPAIKTDKKNPFGWQKVKGSIDGYELKKYHLMPMKGGDLFLPVNATIRKAINEKEGDHIEVILYIDSDPVQVPDEMMMCLQDEPVALDFFNTLSDTDQQNYVDWIYVAKKEDTRVDRLAKTVVKLLNNKRFYDK